MACVRVCPCRSHAELPGRRWIDEGEVDDHRSLARRKRHVRRPPPDDQPEAKMSAAGVQQEGVPDDGGQHMSSRSQLSPGFTLAFPACW